MDVCDCATHMFAVFHLLLLMLIDGYMVRMCIMCVCACVRACMRACMCVCVRA